MSISTLLRSALTSDTGIAAIVSTRIYPLILPQHPTYEAISYQRISNTGQDGTSDRKESRWQINCWAETYTEAQALAAAVKAGLEEYHDSDQTPGIEYVTIVNELDDYDDDAKVYRVIVDAILKTTGD